MSYEVVVVGGGIGGLTTAALLAAPTDANAQWRRGWGGPAIGLGILGGVAAGAIIGGAIANSYGPAYVVQPGYAPYPAYYAGPPVGYWAFLRDPDGHTLEVSFGQQVGLTVSGRS